VHRPDSPARWRGAATALLTAALSIGAHVLAGGSTSGAGVSLVLVVAGTLGAVAAGAHRARRTPGLIGLLAAGQLLCHLVLAAAGHSHAAGGGLSPLMLGTHAVAVIAGALLIAAGDRLWRALSTTVRTLTALSSSPPEPLAIRARMSDQPLQSMLRLAASVSRRGPPVGVLS